MKPQLVLEATRNENGSAMQISRLTDILMGSMASNPLKMAVTVNALAQNVELPPFSNFTRPLGVFHQEKIVFRLPSIIPYMACRQNFSCRSRKLAIKISVIVRNTYCVKYSLSYTALYWYLSKKSCHLLADSSINSS